MSDCILNLLPVQGDEPQAFQAIAPDATHIYATRSTVTQEQLAQATIILGGPRYEDIAYAKNLKWFHSQWAGMDEYIGKADFPQGCRVSGSAGTNAQSVAEHMFAALLSLCRRIPEIRDYQNQHQWYNVDRCKTLDGSTVLVVGAGNIGRRFGKLCQHMGAHTTGLQRTPCDGLDGFHAVETMDKLNNLLPTADVVALCLPGTTETNNLMNADRFALMKSESIFLNAGRGNAVDHIALMEHLESGKLWAASTDVPLPEPLPSDSPLWDTKNLLVTPHCAGGMRLDITRKNAIELALQNLQNYYQGEALINEVQL